jgi:hypothetical protein
MSTSLPLHSMVMNVINGAKEKLAADQGEKEKVKTLLKYEKQEHGGHVPTPSEEEAEKIASEGFTDPNYIEKLAASVEFIAEHLDEIEPTQQGPVAQALAKVAAGAAQEGSPAGPGKRPGALPLSTPTPGQQKYKKDKPKTEDAAESETGSPLSTAGRAGGKTQLDNNMHKAPGQSSGQVPHAKYPAKGPLVNQGKSKTAAEIAKDHILLKLAGEDVFPAKINGGGTTSPLAGKGQLRSMKAGDEPPKASGGPTGDFGNQSRKHIASIGAAIDYTKKDAKGPQKTQVKQLLEEPMQSKAHDSKVHENLRNADKGGVKIAAVKNLFAKIAAAGCTCGGKGECNFDLLKEAASRVGREKTAMGMGMGAGAPAQMGGGMGAMAMAGAGADGCTCGNAGECRVCKLKAELAAAKAQAGAAPMGAVPGAGIGGAPAMGAGVQEKDSMGAGCAY